VVGLCNGKILESNQTPTGLLQQSVHLPAKCIPMLYLLGIPDHKSQIHVNDAQRDAWRLSLSTFPSRKQKLAVAQIKEFWDAVHV
jgi:hypothetical protein